MTPEEAAIKWLHDDKEAVYAYVDSLSGDIKTLNVGIIAGYLSNYSQSHRNAFVREVVNVHMREIGGFEYIITDEISDFVRAVAKTEPAASALAISHILKKDLITVYDLGDRAEEYGYVKSLVVPGTAERGYRKKRLWTLTEIGRTQC